MFVKIRCQECGREQEISEAQLQDELVVVGRCGCAHIKHNDTLELALGQLLEYEQSEGRLSVEVRLPSDVSTGQQTSHSMTDEPPDTLKDLAAAIRALESALAAVRGVIFDPRLRDHEDVRRAAECGVRARDLVTEARAEMRTLQALYSYAQRDESFTPRVF